MVEGCEGLHFWCNDKMCLGRLTLLECKGDTNLKLVLQVKR